MKDMTVITRCRVSKIEGEELDCCEYWEIGDQEG